MNKIKSDEIDQAGIMIAFRFGMGRTVRKGSLESDAPGFIRVSKRGVHNISLAYLCKGYHVWFVCIYKLCIYYSLASQKSDYSGLCSIDGWSICIIPIWLVTSRLLQMCHICVIII